MSAPYDMEWVCTACGKVQTKNPQRYQYDEFLCDDCEAREAEEWMNHMRQVAHENTD